MAVTGQWVLIIDDEPDIRELIDITISRMGLNTQTAENLEFAKKALLSKEFNLVLTDMKLPDGNGIDFVEQTQHSHPNLPIAVITAFGSMDTAITALKAGAFDFLSKPIDIQQLRDLVTRALQLGQEPSPEFPQSPFTLLGKSNAMQQLQSRINKLARSQAPVYISGESGSGKELVARMIHSLGPRQEGPFIPVNCGAIPSELMESEFFGHKKGSFSGAVSDKTGLFQAANGGTLFLDEVADLPLHMQVKLLRAIQEKSIRPIGDQREHVVDIRILSATHKDLQELVSQGKFRQDLFYRINVIQLNVPPLRERKDDILILAEHFTKRLAKEWSLEPPTLSNQAKQALMNYSFPGNVRELENTLERALTLCDQDEIKAEHLQLDQESLNATIDGAAGSEQMPNIAEATENADQSLKHLDISLEEIGSLEDYLAKIEKEIIIRSLESTRWNRTAAAKKLGMTFRSLRYRLKKLGIDEQAS